MSDTLARFKLMSTSSASRSDAAGSLQPGPTDRPGHRTAVDKLGTANIRSAADDGGWEKNHRKARYDYINTLIGG